jgi:cytochrome c5
VNRSVNRTKDAAMACQKNPYHTQFVALHALEAIRAAGKSGKQPVRAYPCEHCHHWHLTSKKRTGKVPKWERRLSLTGG